MSKPLSASKKNPTPHTSATSEALTKLLAVLPIKPDLVGELALSIAALGLLEPIKRINGAIIDGRHRELACRQVGVQPRYVDISLITQKVPADGDAMAELFVAHNVIRNHLSLGERALIAASYATLEKGANQHTAQAERFSRKALSGMFSISEDTIDRGKTLLESGRTDLIETVKHGASPSRAVRILELERNGARVQAIAGKSGAAATNMTTMADQVLNIGIVLADPPWAFGTGVCTQESAPEWHYPTMPLEDIKALPVGKLAAADSVCWLWVPNFLIPQGLEVLRAWGFHFVTSMVWVKPTQTPTTGAILPCHETLLVGARGAGLPALPKGMPRTRSWHQAPIVRHSQKPSYFADEIDRIYPAAAKLELFARCPRKGWLTWGNEVVGAVPVSDKAANDG